MTRLETSIEIDAPPARVWPTVADFGSFREWNPFVRSIEGELRVGSRLRVRIEPPGMKGVTLRPKLVMVDPPYRIRWLGHLWVPGLFDGEHCFEIAPLGTTRSRFFHVERFRGLLVSLLWRRLEEPTRAGFEAMNAALKRRVEGSPASTERRASGG